MIFPYVEIGIKIIEKYSCKKRINVKNGIKLPSSTAWNGNQDIFSCRDRLRFTPFSHPLSSICI